MRKEVTKYNHVYQLRIGDIIKVNGFPLEYLGNNRFGTNTRMHFKPRNINDNLKVSIKVEGGKE